MALLAFDSSPAVPPAIAELLSPAQRMKTAGELNAAILESFSHGKEAKLVGLIKLLCWGEHMLGEKAEFPKVGLSFRIGTHFTLVNDTRICRLILGTGCMTLGDRWMKTRELQCCNDTREFIHVL